jgi:ketosteroid isomerase-like protein
MSNPTRDEILAVLERYADAWLKGDMKTIIDSYHDDVVFHYAGRSPLAGAHRGKQACLAVLKQVSQKTNRKLLSIKDVMAGNELGIIVAIERFGAEGDSVELERLLRYRVRDGKLCECWIYDFDQALVDRFYSMP